MGERKPRLHLGILFGDRFEHTVGDGPIERGLEPTAVVDRDLAAAVAVHRTATAADARVERGGAPFHLEREVDLPLRVDPRDRGRRQPGQHLEWARLGQHVGVVGMVVAAIEQRLIDQAVERRRLEVGGIGKTNAMLPKGAKTDPATFRRHQRLDLAFVNPDRELGASRDVQLGVLRPLCLAARQQALPDRVHWRMAPAGTTPVPPTLSSEMRMVGWPTETGTPCPSLPQVPGASFRSLATMSILCRARGPLPTMVAPRTARPIRPASIR